MSELIGARRPAPASRAAGIALLTLGLVAGCAQSGTAAAQADRPSGSTYAGWRLYNARCAACHGVDAAGPAKVPGMLDRVREMGAARFASLVLDRYDWPPSADDEQDRDARTALLDDILHRRETPLEMPAWADEPAVSAHVLDLYAYLTARADGVIGPGRPRS